MKHYIFADESNLNSKFMLIGGIWVDEITYKVVIERCNTFKESIGWTSDAKFNWKNVSKLTLPKYKNFIDIFFEFNLKFNTIIIDKSEINLRKNYENDAELGFYKFYYLLLWHNSVRKQEVEYWIYLDRRNNKKETRLDDLKKHLQRDKANLINNIWEEEKGLNIKLLEPVNSKYYNLIQFTDILLGAFGFYYNQRHINKNVSQVKYELAQYIATKIGRNNLCFSTFKKGYKNLNIWKFDVNRIKSAL